MKKVLVLGSSSFTGYYITKQLSAEFELISSNRSGENADFVFDAENADTSSLEAKIADVDVVVNCISNGDVDNCETNPEHSQKINYDFVVDLCRLQNKFNFHLIHFSTNAIYDGENAPYSENSLVNPVNKYGEIKSKADQFIESNASTYTILRPITMYGVKLEGQRHNPFSFFHQQLSENKDITAVDDVYVNMLHIEDLVKCVSVVISGQITGTYNISGDDVVNRYEFVSMIKNCLPNSQSKIKKVSSDQFETAAERPKNTSFDNTAMKRDLGVYPDSLESVLRQLSDFTQIEETKAA